MQDRVTVQSHFYYGNLVLLYLGHYRDRKLSFPDVIVKDTGIRIEDLGTAIVGSEVWRNIVDFFSDPPV